MADNNTKQDDGSLAFLNIPRNERTAVIADICWRR